EARDGAVEQNERELAGVERVQAGGGEVRVEAGPVDYRRALHQARRLPRVHQLGADIHPDVQPVALTAEGPPVRQSRLRQAQAHAQVLGEGVVRLDNAGLDHDLAHRDVDLRDQAADLVEAA